MEQIVLQITVAVLVGLLACWVVSKHIHGISTREEWLFMLATEASIAGSFTYSRLGIKYSQNQKSHTDLDHPTNFHYETHEMIQVFGSFRNLWSMVSDAGPYKDCPAPWARQNKPCLELYTFTSLDDRKAFCEYGHEESLCKVHFSSQDYGSPEIPNKRRHTLFYHPYPSYIDIWIPKSACKQIPDYIWLGIVDRITGAKVAGIYIPIRLGNQKDSHA